MRPGRIVAPVLPAAGLVLLGRTGGGTLDVPLGSAAAVADWTATTAPVPLAMALVRLAAQSLCGYLLLATGLQALAEALGYRWLHALATRAFPTVLRRTLASGAGFGLAAGSILWTGGTPAGASILPAVKVLAGHEDLAGQSTATMVLLPPAPSHPTATMTLLAPPPDTTTPGTGPPTTAAPATTPKATATMRLLEPLPTTTAPASGQPSVPVAGADDDEIWVVESGDSFWSIAEDMVGDGAALDAYWHQLIAANRVRLAVPDQPDLLFPGQVLTLPKPATSGSGV